MEMELNEGLQNLWESVKDIEIGMFSTVDEEGAIRSRPMATQKAKFNGAFFSQRASEAESLAVAVAVAERTMEPRSIAPQMKMSQKFSRISDSSIPLQSRPGRR